MRRSLNSFFLLVLAINFIFLNTLPIFAITYGVVSLFLLGGFAYLTFKITSKNDCKFLN